MGDSIIGLALDLVVNYWSSYKPAMYIHVDWMIAWIGEVQVTEGLVDSHYATSDAVDMVDSVSGVCLSRRVKTDRVPHHVVQESVLESEVAI